MVNRDDEIRKRREQKRQRAADKTAQSPPIDAKLALLQHINAPEELQGERLAAEIEDGKVVLKRQGKRHGEWRIHDAWFEYRPSHSTGAGRQCDFGCFAPRVLARRRHKP